jgi:hypothetical protein
LPSKTSHKWQLRVGTDHPLSNGRAKPYLMDVKV